MTTYDNAPPTPDWKPPSAPIVGCRSCTLGENLCSSLIWGTGSSCCGSCDHRAEVEPILWTGDQV